MLEKAKLAVIGHKNETSALLMKTFASRERVRSSTDLRRVKQNLMREGATIVQNDYMQFWKDLQAAGAGTIVYGTRGAPNRFEWGYSMKEVGRLGTEQPEAAPAPVTVPPQPGPLTPEEAQLLLSLLGRVLRG